MSITAEHMVFNLERWNVAQVKAAGTCVWTCSGHSCRWTNRSSEGQLPGSLAPNLSPQAQTSPAPRRAQGLRPAQVQGRVPGLCRLHPRSLWTLNSHNGAVQCEEDLPRATGQWCGILVRAWTVSKLEETHRCHFISWVPGTSDNSSSLSVLPSTTGGWHTHITARAEEERFMLAWPSEQSLTWQALHWVLPSLDLSVLVSSPQFSLPDLKPTRR